MEDPELILFQTDSVVWTEAPGSLYIQARGKTFIWKIVWLLLIVFAK